MNVFPLIESTLTPLKIPLKPEVYKGMATEYITCNYSDERPVLSADDNDQLDETTVQVHYFTKGDPHTTKAKIRRLLHAAGFNIISIQQFYEDDTQYRHVVVEASIDGEINQED